ncbi:hypothetical protein [Ramlibacter sp.]|uniref:hypothetical protein n=1 Tax=Ramlibacter sp. TaxID=1917967 RepID=UPI002FCBC959
MDWFERITGFREGSWAETQRRLSVVEGRLHVDGASRGWRVGRLELPTLGELRARVAQLQRASAPLRVSVVQGDVRQLHASEASAGALFQVASQFNLLEMVGPDVTPEQGVTRYAFDRTQGPACAIAAGAGTILRNYLVELPGGRGQTAGRQLDALDVLGAALGNAGGRLWSMRNGYAMFTPEGLREVDERLAAASPARVDGARALLRIGLQHGVQVTDVADREHIVSQAFCSALPVSYNRLDDGPWARIATLVLEAAYEATLLAGVLNTAHGGSAVVHLTRLGGGAFGNDDAWITAAMRRAFALARGWGLDVRMVAYGAPGPHVQALLREFG